MIVRTIQKNDFSDVAEMCAVFFPIHTIFQQAKSKVIAYLKAQKDLCLVAVDHTKIQGALFLVKEGKDGSHTRWKLRHFAFKSDAVAKQLLAEAEKRISTASRTAKIEVTLAYNERGRSFYLKHGFALEGSLKNHYRWKETCLLLGKSLAGR